MFIVLPILLLTAVLVVLVVLYLMAVRATYGRANTGFAEKLTRFTRQKFSEPAVHKDEPEQIDTLPVDDIEDDESIEEDEPAEEEYVPAFVEESDGDIDTEDEEELPEESADEPLPWDE